MIGLGRQRGLETAPPGTEVLPGGAEDEVEADVVESHLAGQPCHLHGTPGPVTTIQNRQDGLIGGLHSHGQSVDPGREQPRKHILVQGFRVGLRGDLGVVVDPPRSTDVIDELSQLGRGEHRRSASPEENGGHRRTPSPHLPSEVQLAMSRLQVTRDGVLPHGCEHIGVEVAVSAPGRTERHVQIDAPWAVSCLELGQVAVCVSHGPPDVQGANAALA